MSNTESGKAGLAQQLRDGVLWLAFDRPRASNAIDAALSQALAAALTEAANDAMVVAAVITGAGDKVFSAGIDIKNPDALEHEALATLRRETVARCLGAIVEFAKPLVAAVNGPAIGLGCMLALLADHAVASERAAFSLPEINIGIPTLLGASIVTRAAGAALARELVLTGRRMDALEARQRGLVSAILRPGELTRAAQHAAQTLAAKPQAAYALNKRWFNRGLREEFDAANAASQAAQPQLAADHTRQRH
jgi:enoyl-CoA hydratase/carnithine racemase